METVDVLKLIGAIILGYAMLLFTMWLFRRGNKKPEVKPRKK